MGWTLEEAKEKADELTMEYREYYFEEQRKHILSQVNVLELCKACATGDKSMGQKVLEDLENIPDNPDRYTWHVGKLNPEGIQSVFHEAKMRGNLLHEPSISDYIIAKKPRDGKGKQAFYQVSFGWWTLPSRFIEFLEEADVK